MTVGRVAALAASLGLWASASALQAGVVIEQLAPGMSGQSDRITGLFADTGRVGETRVFLTRKHGPISVYDRATGTYSIFQDLSGRVTQSSANERGLLGLAFDPDYETNGHYYTFLTSPQAGGGVQAQIIRFTDSLVVPGSAGAERTIWTMNLDNASVHLGGWIDFDASGKLLVALGDGGSGAAPDPRGTGQNPSDWFGSILRIDPAVDGFPADPARNYAIPGDNPLLGSAAAPSEVYVYGLRNPYRNTVTPDGRLIVADVGHDSREELTIVDAGAANRNLGWPIREGDMATPGVSGALPADYLAPDLVYGRDEGGSIVGGFVYRGSAVPDLVGHYVFGDYVSGAVWAIRYADGRFIGDKRLLGSIPALVGFGETPEGELLATQFSYRSGALYRLAWDGIAPVPEPATWTSLIAGLALAGGTLRRRARDQAARRVV